MNTQEMQHPASDEPPSPPFPGSDVTIKKRGLYTLPFLNGISTTDLGWVHGTTGCSDRTKLHINGCGG